MQLYNTLKRGKQTLDAIVPGQLGIYLCGITVYDLCHLGHARVMCSVDGIVRYLESTGYKVRLIRNITDIDDKIINRAAELGITTKQVTDTNITKMHQDFAALGLRQPDGEPRATGYIQPIIELIQKLIVREYAYVTASGDVYYRVKKFVDYGQLSGKKIDELITGVRIEPDVNKEFQLDFALWKSAKLGEPQWQSPWGQGRPGWHIECSAMSMQELGSNFDIHAGGPDLIFPHHENEIAQSCAAENCDYAHYWMHVGPLRMGEEKMSKSLGNFITIRDALAEYPPEVWRMWFAMSHYRSPICYQPELLAQAAKVVERLYLRLRDLNTNCQQLADVPQVEMFHRALRDDFNTPVALSALQSIASEMIDASESERQILGATLLHLARSIGLMQADPNQWLRGNNNLDSLDEDTIKQCIENRNLARAAKDFAKADAIRQQLAAAGVVLEDTAKDTLWRRSRIASYD